MHQHFPIQQEWKIEDLKPFDELILSWNAPRPIEGHFLFYVSVKTHDWSPWLLYASWGSKGQSSFANQSQEFAVSIYQDTLEILNGEKATAFQVKIITEDDASLDNIYALHVYTNGDRSEKPEKLPSTLESVDLNISGLSQMTVNHSRCYDLCSPTSTTAVIHYLLNDPNLNPVEFAEQVWDKGFDIYGNWVFNVAQASTYLGANWNCWVERLMNFDQIHHHLIQGNPVVISIRGPLINSALLYSTGHLIVVKGYDASNQQVLCMDPAFPKDNETCVAYALSDLMQAWNRRGNIAYVFSKKRNRFRNCHNQN